MDRNAIRHLSRPVYADILAWRHALELTLVDTCRLTVRATWLPLDASSPHEKAARSDVKVWVDSQGTGGIGVYAPGIAWDGACVPEAQYFLNGGQKAAISNNAFQFFAIVAGLAIAVRAHEHAHVRIFY